MRKTFVLLFQFFLACDYCKTIVIDGHRKMSMFRHNTLLFSKNISIYINICHVNIFGSHLILFKPMYFRDAL